MNNVLARAKEDSDDAWSKLIHKSTVDTAIEQNENTFRNYVTQNLIDSLRVLFDEFASKESNLDIKDRAKMLLKALNSHF